MRASADTQASFAFADAVNVAAFFLTNSCTLIGRCPREREHVVRQPVETPRAMQIAHGRQVVYQVNRPAPLEQLLRHGPTGMS